MADHHRVTKECSLRGNEVTRMTLHNNFRANKPVSGDDGKKALIASGM
jgi:hypothetical protein